MKFRDISSMPLVINVVDIADTLCIGRNKAYDLVNSGQIKAIRIGNQYRVLKDSFVSFLRGNGQDN